MGKLEGRKEEEGRKGKERKGKEREGRELHTHVYVVVECDLLAKMAMMLGANGVVGSMARRMCHQLLRRGFAAGVPEPVGDAPVTQPEPFSHTPAGRNHLFVPGPVNINDRVLRAMNIPGKNHRDPGFNHLVDGLLRDLKYLFKTEK